MARLKGRTRKQVLILHILSAAAWFGIDLALITLALTSMITDDAQTAATAMKAVDLFAIWPMFTAAIVCLASGIVLGLGSKYGLVKYWWVAVKLVINIAFALLIVFSLRHGVGDMADLGARLAAGDESARTPLNMLGPVIVAPTLLLTAYFLSVFKPWGRIRKSVATKPKTTNKVHIGV